MRFLAAFFVLSLSALPVLAVEPDEVLHDPVLEQRARTVSKGLRCVVCQNQSIDDSNADLARGMRILVRQRIVAGDSNRQVLDYMVSRYGDFVLLKPPLKPATYVLWFAPLFFVALGILVLIVFYRRSRRKKEAASVALSDEEIRRLDGLMKDDE